MGLAFRHAHNRPRRPRTRSRHRAIVVVATGVAAAVAATIVLTMPDGKFHVTVLNVGAAPAALVQAPDGALALVDGGNSAAKLDDALGRVLPPTTHRLDLVVITASSPASAGALTGLQNKYEITTAITTAPRTPAITTMLTSFQTSGTSVVDAIGAAWQWHGLRWNAFDLNDNSSVIHVSDGQTAAILLGITGGAMQDDLLAGYGSQLRADLIVAPAGGALEYDLMEAVRPRFVAAPSTSGTEPTWDKYIARTSNFGDLRYTDDNGQMESG